VEPTPYRREPGYAERYRDRRFSTGHGERTDRRERAALRALLASVPAPAGPWLDVPAGAGRLCSLLPGPVVQVDRDAAMLALTAAPGPRVRGCASALPFADGAFAGVLCCRLLQHLPRPEERIAVLRELARVSRGPVVVSFFDAWSLLHLRRRLRRWLGKPRSGRGATSRSTFRREALAAGLVPVRAVALLRLVSEQTLVLCRRAEMG
jgi:ubiquinone/menaquinone biosynthesis C-methylase UbiE